MGLHQFSLDFFKEKYNKMVAASERTQRGMWDNIRETLSSYTPNDIQDILNAGDIEEKRNLSRVYFSNENLYSQLITDYATLLMYSWVLLPNPPANKKNLSNKKIEEKYNKIMNYLERSNLKKLFTEWATKVLVDGAYYGILFKNKESFSHITLPAKYCDSTTVDLEGNSIIKFDVSYFSTIADENLKNSILAAFPKEIVRHYNNWRKGKAIKWYYIMKDGIYFSFEGKTQPLFLNIIPSIIQYKEAVKSEIDREKEEIKKILIQKIPHLSDGTLLFEPEEVEIMHEGTCDMMKGNKNVSVLTSYGEIDSISSRTVNETSGNNFIEKMFNNIFNQAGTSNQKFSPTGSTSVQYSLNNDTAIMMQLANSFSFFFTQTINKIFSNNEITFKFIILPITYHNQKDYISDSFKLAQSGYSFILPTLALGINQNDLVGIKKLEKDIIDFSSYLKPLTSAYTQSSEEKQEGAPKKEIEEINPKTIENQESLENQGG